MLKDIIRDSVAPVLKEYGFRKQSLTWNRGEGDVVQVLDIQPSRWNDAGKEEFTINIGGFGKFAWETCWGKATPKNVTIEECCPAFRAGQILGDFDPQSKDVWWCLSPEMDDGAIAAVRDEVIDVIRSKCLPILDGWQTEGDLLQAITNLPEAVRRQPANLLYYAILLHRNGRQPEAAEELLAFNNPKARAWHDRVLAVKSRLGIVVSTAK